MWCTVDIVEAIKPKFVVWENVKNILSKKHIHNFNNYIEIMNQLGYNSYYQVLNSKDFSIPQNRERVYAISIRKDIDNGNFKFPDKQELKIRLKDILEDVVDEKYYLKKTDNISKKENYLQWDNSGKGYNSQQDRAYYQDGLSPALSSCNSGDKSQIVLADKEKSPCTYSRNFGIKCKSKTNICNTLQEVIGNGGENIPLIQVGNLKGGKWNKINESCRRVYSEEGISPTIHTCQGGNTEPKIQIKAKNIKEPILIDNPLKGKSNYGWHFEQNVYGENSQCCRSVKASNGSGNIPKIIAKDENALDKPICLNSKGGRNGISSLQPSLKDRIYTSEGISTCCATSNFFMPNYTDGFKIRKLTPKECWRLMRFYR